MKTGFNIRILHETFGELLNETLGSHIPFVILKSMQLLEALTAILSVDARTRPVYEKSSKIGEHVLFVL